jgi:Protein O-mannosyl-transferase TMEM260-like
VQSRHSLRVLAAVLGLAFVLAHLTAIVTFLDDIDAINFALGLREFDVALHQPHPPGYPVYIFLGKLMLMAAGSFSHATSGVFVVEAMALSLWSILAGGLAAVPLAVLFLHVEESRPRAIAALVLTLACPLFWFTAVRPLSDVPGLAMALLSQALAAAAFARQRGWAERSKSGGNGAIAPEEIAASGRLIVLSALVAGLAIGMRSQTVWLTLPLIALVIVDRAGRAAAGALLGAALAFGIGVVVWFIPMLVATGGPKRYLSALTSQAGEDFEGVDMLVTSTAPARRLALNLFQTFAQPWVSPPLAIVVLAFAAIGAIAMLRGSRRGLALLGGIAVPYAIFHLGFQENETIRYALPLVPPTVYLAVRGIDAVLRRGVVIGAAVVAAAALWVAVPSVARYAHGSGAPIFHLFEAMRETANNGAPAPDVVGMHRRVFTESRRARQWAADGFPWKLLPAPRDHEWLELVKYWRGGGDRPIWFVADPRRTDLALIDPAARRVEGRYRWSLATVPPDPLSRTLARYVPALFEDPAMVGGARPDICDWFIVSPPGWFLGEGWALTPETSGIADREKKGPGFKEAVGYIRRRPEAVQVMIGGRNLGAASDPLVRFTLLIDGRPIDSWEAKPDPGFFLRSLTLPAGALEAHPAAGTDGHVAGAAPAAAPLAAVAAPAATDGAGLDRWAVVTVRAESASSGAQPVHAAVEQFDLQPLDGVMVAYDQGWHEAEFDPRRGLAWHWSGDAAMLRVWSGGQDVEVRLSVEAPRRYFDTPPTVTLRAGTQTLRTISTLDDFTMAVRVPASALKASGGLLTLSTDRVFVPAEHRRGSTDRRRLGLRVFDVTVAHTESRASSR